RSRALPAPGGHREPAVAACLRRSRSGADVCRGDTVEAGEGDGGEEGEGDVPLAAPAAGVLGLEGADVFDLDAAVGETGKQALADFHCEDAARGAAGLCRVGGRGDRLRVGQEVALEDGDAVVVHEAAAKVAGFEVDRRGEG